MQYIVFDLEWNQSPTGRVIANKNGSRIPFEIIEIGAVKLDENKNVISSFDRLIRPQVYFKFHKVVENMLPITMKDLQKGKDFKTVYEEFINWCGTDFYFCTWGEADLMQFQRNMSFYGIENNFPMPFLYFDLQKVYSKQYLDDNMTPSLESAVKALDIAQSMQYHRAIHDAQYTAQIMQKLKDEDLIENVSVDTFRIPKRPADEIRKRSRFSEEYITRGFDCKEKATKYRELRKGSCFICSETMDRVVRWFSDNKNYYAVFKCKKHGLISAKFKVKKSDLGYFYGVRNMSRIDESAAETIKEKRDREREKQKEYERNE